MTIWRKSSRSGGGEAGGQDCVELACLPGTIGIRDSKSPELGHLTVSREELGRLIDLGKAGALDLK